MSLIRYDVTTNDWVIFAPERVRRPPANYGRIEAPAAAVPGAALCPFCPGNEQLTGKEIHQVSSGGSSSQHGWSVRVVANKFPALRIEANHFRHEEGPLFRCMDGCGAHEVLIESPEHDRILAMQPVEQVERVLGALQARFNDLMRDVRFQTIIIFKNHGEGAGTSLRHPHWQLIATPVVPRLHRNRHAVATDYFDQNGRCLYCALLDEELMDGRRVVFQNEHFTAFVPYAAHVPYETWIMPKHHCSSFGREESWMLRPLAEVLKTVLAKLHAGFGNPDFNLTVSTVPRGDEDKEYFLWHMQILPRLTTPAGFEMGSGMTINAVLPEDAAKALRDLETTAYD